MKKKCSGCKQEKDIEEFSWENKAKNERQSKCKSCSKIYQDAHYAENKEAISLKNKAKRDKYRQFVWDYLKLHPCVDCGEIDPTVLEFDHKDPNEKDFMVSEGRNYNMDRVLEEMQKCEIRCANCHKRKTAIQFGWYKDIVK